MIEVRSPVNQFFDVDGTPLDAGYIYIGVTGANPETSPQSIYWDKEGTIPAVQPIRTLNGYPARDGAVSKFYTATKNYSVTVKDKRGILVMSTLNSDSGVFDELAAAAGASNVGYDNAASLLVSDNVQEAIDELKDITDAQDAIINSSLYGFNLFPNSAFLLNTNGYVSGNPTTGANEETLDGLHVITTGEFVTFTPATFGNSIIAPAGGAYVTIYGGSITGGEYACKWEGSGTILVNGVFHEKSAPFTLTANNNAVVTLNGQFSNVQFTRPNMLGTYEYDKKLDEEKTLWKGGTGKVDGWNELGSQATTSGTGITFSSIPSWVKEWVLMFRGVSINAASHLRIRLGTSGGLVLTGYSGIRQYINMVSATAGATVTDGFYVHLGAAAVISHGEISGKSFGSIWATTGLFADTGSSGTSVQAGSLDLAGLLTQIEIAPVSGSFDAGTIYLLGRA